MSFWTLNKADNKTSACYCEKDGKNHSYAELRDNVAAFSQACASPKKQLAVLLCDNSFATITAYLGILNAGHAAMLLSAQMDRSLLDGLIDQYQPEILWDVLGRTEHFGSYNPVDFGGEGGLYHRACAGSPVEIHPELAVLLSTSGTTGSAKFVRLSFKNLQSNAESIAKYLELTERDVAITSLPFSYSYGLSVINSHLLVGGKIVCSNASIVNSQLWKLIREQSCTFFAGVPFTYETIAKLRFERMDLPSVRVMTQAGGRLSKDRIQEFAELSSRKGFAFYVMYGQTEATARISYVPPAQLGNKIGSIGVSIPGGSLRIQKEGVMHDGPGVEGELVYEGPNVMLGYAEQRHDLAKGDELGGVLRTGDIGYKDADGYFFVTGRLKRFIKIYGSRVNLDEVERMLESHGIRPAACMGSDDKLIILVQTDETELIMQARQSVVDLYKLHHSVVHVKPVQSLPLTLNGKKDYERMKQEWANVDI